MKYEEVEVNSERWLDLTPLLNEEFRDIKGFEGYCQVSNYGRIKTLERKVICGNRYNDKKGFRIQQPKILKLCYDKDKYLRISLYKNKHKIDFCVHRLVAETFIKKENFKSMPYENKNLIILNKLVINHKDEKKSNNNVSNLEWCTVAYNNCYGDRIKNVVRKNKKAIIQFDENNNKIREWDSPTTASKELKICKSSIINCCNKKPHSITAGGYKFKYKEEK